jgi:hypothetical protein
MIILIITASGPKVGRLSVVDYSMLNDRERDVVRRLIPPDAYREGRLQTVLDLARALYRGLKLNGFDVSVRGSGFLGTDPLGLESRKP